MSASKKRKTDLVFTGAAMFRQRIVCSLLSGKAIRIDHIRADEEAPGLTDYEASLLRLVDKVCAISLCKQHGPLPPLAYS